MESLWPWVNDIPRLPETLPDGAPWPRISIVTPSLNQGQFIEETIRSVLLQGYPNLEYIIIDGGSTDETLDIIRKYESRLAYWVSEKDDGQSDAINKGWGRASGDILAWLNSDDMLLPGSLARAAVLFHEHPEAGLIHARSQCVDGQGAALDKTYGADCDLSTLLLTARNWISQPAAFVSRRAVEQVGRLNTRLHVSMDWDLWIRILAWFPAYFVPETWALMRQWEGAKTENIHSLTGVEHLESVLDFIRGDGLAGWSAKARRQALAATYGRAALGEFQQERFVESRRYLLTSLVLQPSLGGGYARKHFFRILLGPDIVKLFRAARACLRSGGLA